MHVRHRFAAVALITVLASGLLAACTTTTPTTPEAGASSGSGEKIATSLGALITQELARDDLSDFEREVLERSNDTGRIDPADYEDAFSRYSQCVANAGYDEIATKLPNGLYQVSIEFPKDVDGQKYGEQYNAVAEKCATGTRATIEALYRLQQGNDELLSNPHEIAVQCLIEAELVPGDFTADDLERLFDAAFQNPPFDPGTTQAQTCFSNAGLAVAVGG